MSKIDKRIVYKIYSPDEASAPEIRHLIKSQSPVNYATYMNYLIVGRYSTNKTTLLKILKAYVSGV